MPTLEQLLRRNYPVAFAVERDAEGNEHVAAWLLDLPGCIAQGKDEPTARAALERLRAPYFRSLLEIGATIAEPTTIPALIMGHIGFYKASTYGVSAETSKPEVIFGASSGFRRFAPVT